MNIIEYIFEMRSHYFRAGVYHTTRDPQTDYTSGNHHVINATHHAILKMHDTHTQFDEFESEGFIEACRHSSGVFLRSPGNMQQQAHDDLLAISCTSEKYAKEIAETGLKKWYLPWYYDNTPDTPKLEARNWFGRFGWTIYTFSQTAGLPTNIIHNLCFAAYIVSS